ncbi:acyltransferase family protein [Salinimicrobium flavum]|uniref:Acyltransferase family protein n=1 Tax=Salinimicrobium flavum TaxID=1737065 RepID=A0ABW5IT28_9FLAO
MTINPKKRIDELDSLRGIAAIIVVLYHYTFRFEELFNFKFITKYFNVPYGHYGVELFFAISGFVIFMSIEKINNPFKFLYKRFVRLYPTFWVGMILSFICISLFGPELLKVNISEFLINFTMIPSFFNIDSVDGVYWTLKVEMFFYLVIFLVLLLKKKESYKLFGYIYILMGTISFIVLKPTYYYFYGSLFLIGINFYKIWKGTSDWQNHLQIFICLGLTLFYPKLEFFAVTTLIVFIFYLMVFGKLKFLKISILLFLGKISYSLYLIHQYLGYTIQLKLIYAGIENFIVLLIIPLLISILIASLITFYIEKPIISFLSKKEPYRIKAQNGAKIAQYFKQ